MKPCLLLIVLLGHAIFMPRPAAAADNRDQPPAGIAQHYKWSLLPKFRPNAIARFEGFWAKYHPGDEKYRDAAQARYVRLCAYRLAGLYAADGRKDKAREMLNWLESRDNALR